MNEKVTTDTQSTYLEIMFICFKMLQSKTIILIDLIKYKIFLHIHFYLKTLRPSLSMLYIILCHQVFEKIITLGHGFKLLTMTTRNPKLLYFLMEIGHMYEISLR